MRERPCFWRPSASLSGQVLGPRSHLMRLARHRQTNQFRLLRLTRCPVRAPRAGSLKGARKSWPGTASFRRAIRSRPRRGSRSFVRAAMPSTQRSQPTPLHTQPDGQRPLARDQPVQSGGRGAEGERAQRAIRQRESGRRLPGHPVHARSILASAVVRRAGRVRGLADQRRLPCGIRPSKRRAGRRLVGWIERRGGTGRRRFKEAAEGGVPK